MNAGSICLSRYFFNRFVKKKKKRKELKYKKKITKIKEEKARFY